MTELNEFAKRLLKDASGTPGSFGFERSSNYTWQITPYGPITDPEECIEIKIALETLQTKGLIRENDPNGGMFELTAAGYEAAKRL